VWAGLTGVDTSRTPERVWAGFRSFDDAFTRRVSDPVLPGAPAEIAISPADGVLRAIGRVSEDLTANGDGTRIPSKWGEAELRRLVGGDAELASRFAGGLWANVYLAPRDYHRVHAPLDGALTVVRRVPGRLLPLWDAVLAEEPALFHVNERVILHGDGPLGPWLLVLVAAFGVGSVEVLGEGERRRGEEVAVFHMGSTAILVLPRTFEFVDGVTLGSVRCGSALARPSRR
jgi:phosphatidylserine decarboxylase